MMYLAVVDFFVAATIISASLPGVYMLQFTSSPPDGDTVYACAGDVVQFPWQVSLASGETLTQIQWLHVARNRRLVALTAGGHFLAMSDYDQRVSQLHNAGLRLSSVSKEDEGTLVIEVSGHDRSGKFTELHRTLILKVQTGADAPRVSGGRLQMEQSPSAVRRSGQWHLELTCGTFSFLGEPSVSVVWKTPSGSTVHSSSYSGGKFHLLLPNPVRGGHYSCHIPRHAPAVVCLSPNNTVLTAGSVAVEETVARVTILEAENKQLKSELQYVVQNVAAYKPARQSSTYYSSSADRAVDNILDTYYYHMSCSTTDENGRDPHPWWRVDLGRDFDVNAVVITSRGDCCGSRLANVYVEVFTEDPALNSRAASTRCAFHNGIIGQGVTKALRCAQPCRGRFVRIRKNTEVLTLCEVQVMAPLFSSADL